MKNILKNGDNLSLNRVNLLNFLIMLIYMWICKSSIQGADYLSAGEGIVKAAYCFRIQMLINFGFLIYFVIKKARYNWQVILSNMVALFFLHLIVFIFTFVSVN